MQWSDLFAAVALLLVFEGILPFLKPEAFRAFAKRLESISDRQLRVGGFLLMLSGVIVLLVVR